MKCHCNEIEEMRVENDLLRDELSRARAAKVESETEAADAVAAQVLAEAKLAKIAALLEGDEVPQPGAVAERLRMILDA